jgi:hypothetical protein
MNADVLGREGFAHNPSTVVLGCLFAGQVPPNEFVHCPFERGRDKEVYGEPRP